MTQKPRKPRANCPILDGLALTCFGRLDRLTPSTWARLNRVKAELLEAGLSEPEELNKFDDWLWSTRPYHLTRRPYPEVIPAEWDKWQASQTDEVTLDAAVDEWNRRHA